MPTTAKACGQYVNSILAIRAAASGGYDEALLLDMNGSICEGSGENIFLVHGRTVLTNCEQDSILMGVTRDAVIMIARFGLTARSDITAALATLRHTPTPLVGSVLLRPQLIDETYYPVSTDGRPVL